MKYQAVIFDMGDIFFDATPWRRWLTGHLQSYGVTVDYNTLCQRWEAKLLPVYRGQKPYWVCFGELLAEFGLAPDACAAIGAAAHVMASRVRKRELFPGVAETLFALHAQGIRMAVLSDTESSEANVRTGLAEMGIESCFDAVITSADTGCVKPEAESYHAALRRLGVDANAAIFVGHDEDELIGAQQAGLVAVAFNHLPGVNADINIRYFTDLFAVVRGVVSGPPEVERESDDDRFPESSVQHGESHRR